MTERLGMTKKSTLEDPNKSKVGVYALPTLSFVGKKALLRDHGGLQSARPTKALFLGPGCSPLDSHECSS